MKPYARRQGIEAILTDRAKSGLSAQFGQKHDSSTNNGSEACTHVALQLIVYVWKGIEVTIDDLSGIAGYRPDDVGMNSVHIDRVMAHYNLPYTASFRAGRKLNAGIILQTAREEGPVLVAVPYGIYPTQKGIDGPNGDALQGGRNDLGFAGNHATVVATARWRQRIGQYRPRILDPDHGSPSRPDIPRFDVIDRKSVV